MPQFHYIALNQEQKELSGVIEAPDEPLARKKLNEINLSVVSLTKIDAVAATDTKTKFDFEAIDKNGKKVVGTIVADDQVKAYARLFEEYQLNISALFLSDLTPEEKKATIKQGTTQIQKDYERIYGRKIKATENEEMSLDERAKRKELLDKIDFTMRRIEDFLKEFGPEIKMEERTTIQAYLNQLMRIKDSTNLEHIRSTCERMLNHIQKQELFLHEDLKLRESAKMKVETKNLLTELKHTGIKQDIDFIKIATKLQQINFLKPAAEFVLRLFNAQNPAIRKLKDDIKAVNGQIFLYIKMFIFAKNNAIRIEAWESIKALREERKRIKLNIESLTMEERGKKDSGQPESLFWQHTATALGWILAFYLLSYVVAYPFTIKKFSIGIPRSFYFYRGGLTETITLFLFISYGAITIRNYWLSKHSVAIYLLLPISLVGFLLIVINLM